jgi:parallel beta-helix repeat protein
MLKTQSFAGPISLIVVAALVWPLIGLQVGTAEAASLHVPKDFATIQAAVDAAQPGDIVHVARGTFSENVVIMDKTDLRLLGPKTTLDGSGVGGIGIHVWNSAYITIQGFTIEGYEAGVVLEETHHSRVHNIETRFNDSGTPSLRDGLQLVAADHNRITNVYAHDNGHNGITLKESSTDNILQGNTANDNGQNPAVAANIGGCGIQLISSGNDNNTLLVNETLRNGWGIQVGGGSDGNQVGQNSSHENQRAGIVVLDPGSGNFIGQNKATGNGLADVAPSGTFDLFDQGLLDNIWRNNEGTANF